MEENNKEIKPEQIWNDEKREKIKAFVDKNKEFSRDILAYATKQYSTPIPNFGTCVDFANFGAKWQAERMKEEILKYNNWFTSNCIWYDGWNIRVPLGDKYPEVYTEEEIYEIYKKEQS